MTQSLLTRRAGSFVRAGVSNLRRIVAPAALQLEGELPTLRLDLAGLRQEQASLHDRLGAVEERAARAEARAAHTEARAEELAAEVAVLRDGLHEARRLNLRTAELTDLVTELVLPLHDREIDPSRLGLLPADTL